MPAASKRATTRAKARSILRIHARLERLVEGRVEGTADGLLDVALGLMRPEVPVQYVIASGALGYEGALGLPTFPSTGQGASTDVKEAVYPSPFSDLGKALSPGAEPGGRGGSGHGPKAAAPQSDGEADLSHFFFREGVEAREVLVGVKKRLIEQLKGALGFRRRGTAFDVGQLP